MSEQNRNQSRRFSFNLRWIRWAGTIVTSGLFIWLLTQQDWKLMWATLSRIPTWIFPLAFVLYFLGVLANTLRWFILLKAQEIEVPYGEILKIVLAGNFASNFLPSTVGGDTVRIVSAARFTGWSVSFASVVVDRLLNVFVMMALLPFSWFSFKVFSGFFNSVSTYNQIRTAFLKAGFIAGWVSKVVRLVARWLKKILEAFLVWRDRKGALGWGLMIAFAAKMSVFSAVWFLARGLDISVTISQVIGVGAITYVLSLLPISINGFGLREVTMTTLYMQLGTTLEQASALVVVTRFILMVETLPGALWVSDMLVSQDDQISPADESTKISE
ncbi:MAG: flippase-like domain-containing protein [Anaerolineales bacterium]|nr:flippase-like domain-containing protein [Chloroflexota bacterium]MBL6980225.1 flippase-like domain-containing protein [Anaerolineales bacterium]